MVLDLTGYQVGIIGGDRRELEVATLFQQQGAEVRAVGLPWPDEVTWVSNALEEVVQWANILITPVGGTDEVGHILYSITNGTQPVPRLSESVIQKVRPGTLFFIGKAQPFLVNLARRYGVRLIEFRDLDEFAILNSIPSAEGAIQMAMERSPISIHGSNCLVLGYGRTGITLARMLKGIGAHTFVAARERVDRARIIEAGHQSLDYSQLRETMPIVDHVFNTVPAPVLGEDLIRDMHRDAVIIDLASAPGGTDFTAARRMGITATLAPGLPGIVAPKTAGRIMAHLLLDLIAQEAG